MIGNIFSAGEIIDFAYSKSVDKYAEQELVVSGEGTSVAKIVLN